MTTYVIELPAQNVNDQGASGAGAIVGGLDALLTRDDSTYAELSSNTGQEFYLGGNFAGPGGSSSTEPQKYGFGRASLPSGLTVADLASWSVDLVVRGYVSTDGAIDPAAYVSDGVEGSDLLPAPTRYPVITLDVGSWAFTQQAIGSGFPVGTTFGEVVHPIYNRGYIAGHSWVWDLASDSTATGTVHGLTPRVYMVNYPTGVPSLTVRISYMALRITYDDGIATGTIHAPVLRLFPREDGRGASSGARLYPRPRTTTYGRVGPGVVR